MNEVPSLRLSVLVNLTALDHYIQAPTVDCPTGRLIPPVVPRQSRRNVITPNSIDWIMRRRGAEVDHFSHNKTLLQFSKEGDDIYGWARLVAYWPSQNS